MGYHGRKAPEPPKVEPQELDMKPTPNPLLQTIFNNEQNVNVRHDLSTKEMATIIAVGIYQSPTMVDMAVRAKHLTEQDGIDSSVMQYVAMMASDTALFIEQYTKAKEVK